MMRLLMFVVQSKHQQRCVSPLSSAGGQKSSFLLCLRVVCIGYCWGRQELLSSLFACCLHRILLPRMYGQHHTHAIHMCNAHTHTHTHTYIPCRHTHTHTYTTGTTHVYVYLTSTAHVLYTCTYTCAPALHMHTSTAHVLYICTYTCTPALHM